MKKYLMWTFDRGSRPYDAICAIILTFIFLTPTRLFNDRPEYLRVHNEIVHKSIDDSGKTVYTVQSSSEQAAVDRLHEELKGVVFQVVRSVAVINTRGGVIAYSLWIQ